MKGKILLALLGTVMATGAMAAQGDFLVRGRIINVAPNDSADSTLGTLGIDVKNDTVPELDFTYMITPNIGAELILGTSRHEVTSNGASLGKVSVLPPTLTVQYHFAPDATVRPYIGAGINYTRFYDVGLRAGGANLDVKKNSFGAALQAGVDVAINKSWFVNFDVKKIFLSTDVSVKNGAKLGKLTIDPWVIGIGVGTRF